MSDEGILKKSADVVSSVIGKVVEGVAHILPHHHESEEDGKGEPEHKPEQAAEKPETPGAAKAERKSEAKPRRSGGSKRKSPAKKTATPKASSGERAQTKKELLQQARERGIAGRSKMTKQQLMDALSK